MMAQKHPRLWVMFTDALCLRLEYSNRTLPLNCNIASPHEPHRLGQESHTLGSFLRSLPRCICYFWAATSTLRLWRMLESPQSRPSEPEEQGADLR